VVLAAAAILAACGAPEPAQAPGPAAGEDVAVRGGTARIGLVGGPSTFLDWYAQSTQDLLLADLVFRRLARPGPGPGELVPDLAESWDVLPDGRSVRFQLRRGVLWEDGLALTANDVVFSHQRAADPTSSFHELKKPIERVESLGDWEVVVHFRSANPQLLGHAVLGHIYPRHVLGAVPAQELRAHSFHRRPVGSGPFRLERWEEGQYVSLAARADGAGAARPGGPGVPYLDRVVLRLFRDKAAALRELEGQGLDYLRKIQDDVFDELSALDHLVGLRVPTDEYFYLAWNTTRSPWDRPEVRRALTGLIDRRALARAFEGSDGQVCEGPVPPSDYRHDPSLLSAAFDPERASGELRAAGLTGPPVISILCLAGVTSHLEVASAIADQLRAAGFEAEVRSLEDAVLQSRISSAEFDAAVFVRPQSLPVDLGGCFGTGGIDNQALLSDPELDRILGRLETAAGDLEAGSLFREAYRRVVELQPWTFLFYRAEATLVHARLRGLDAYPRDPIAIIERWWIPASRQ
jgi:peptide/nickel transport system substrate-binding protein